MSEHMLQCAQLAEQARADDAMVAAALLHDIGHFSGDFPDDALEKGIDNLHETTGSALLEGWFPAETVECVRLHVDAKRYLCAVDGDYFRYVIAGFGAHTRSSGRSDVRGGKLVSLVLCPISRRYCRFAAGTNKAKCLEWLRPISNTIFRSCSACAWPE